MSVDNAVMVDETDRKILNVLLENSRLSLRKIAKKVDVSVATAMNRINNLQKQGVIKKYTTKLDYEKIDYDIEALVDITIDRSKSSPFEVDPVIANHPNVYAIYNVSGNIDHILLVKFKNRKQLNNFLKRVSSLPSVAATHTRFILNNFKEDSVKV